MELTTQAKLAKKLSEKSLFHKFGTVSKNETQKFFKKYGIKYDNGLYLPDIINEQLNINKPIWYQKRNGLIKFFTVDTNKLNESEQQFWNRLIKIWNA